MGMMEKLNAVSAIRLNHGKDIWCFVLDESVWLY